MTNKFRFATTVFCVSATAVLTVGCSKDSDFDDLTKDDGIDMSVTIANGGLTLPLGSTDNIFLTELMDTNKVDVLNTDAEGNYYIAESGSMEDSHFNVDYANVNLDPKIDPKDFEFEVSGLDPAVEAQAKELPSTTTLKSLIGDQTVTVYCDNIQFDQNNTFNFNADDIDTGLLAVQSVTLDENEDIVISLHLSQLPSTATAYDVVLSDLILVYPKYLLVAEENEPGKINIGREVLKKQAGQSELFWSKTYHVQGFDFPRDATILNGEVLNHAGNINMQGEINLFGKASISNLQISGSELIVNDKKEIVLAKKIAFDPEIQVNSLPLKSITGRFAPEINDLHSNVALDLSEDMDFLKNDATLNIKDPVVTLNIHNNCNVPILADLELTADNGTQVTFQGINLSKETITLSKNPKGEEADGFYSNPKLGDLLASIPDRIDVLVLPYTDSLRYYSVRLGSDFYVGGDYNVNVPLNFDRLDIKYDEIVEDVWGSNSENITDYVTSIEEAVLTLDATNAIPMKLAIEVTAVGTDGVENDALVSFKTDGTIPAGSIANPTKTTLNITLDIPQIAEVKDLILRVRGNGSDCGFNAKQYLKLDNMKIKIARQELDLNDL